MVIVMRPGSTQEDIQGVMATLRSLGFMTHLSQGVERTIIGAIGEKRDLALASLEALECVERVIPIVQPYKLASREFHPEPSLVNAGQGICFGGAQIPIIAGPCAVEGEEQLLQAARMVKAAGATLLRGGAYKPRTSPYSFQGLHEEGLRILSLARTEVGLPVVSEVLNPRDVELVARHVDVLQVGARNMQNFPLLREVGRSGMPVLLKRGLAATIDEWLMAAEYILREGNFRVILCERGIRTYETATRNTLDLSAVPVVKERSHLPVIVDPSHGTGKWRLVPPMARAAVAAGADGLLIEVHPQPALALSDGAQSLTPANFAALVRDLRRLANLLGREIPEPAGATGPAAGGEREPAPGGCVAG
ncbi:MAG: 3-deoxy-7-phosphoheptulonate synthase [Firmicutes bacterium]|nr:3-deoxy-7-phosphoheptulonate synthase [Bacillota bacterium]